KRYRAYDERLPVMLEIRIAIGESTFLHRERARIVRARIVYLNGYDHVLCFDSIRAHILHRHTTHTARDAGQILKSPEPLCDKYLDQIIKYDTRTSGHPHI